jgi:hypothetical protein
VALDEGGIFGCELRHVSHCIDAETAASRLPEAQAAGSMTKMAVLIYMDKRLQNSSDKTP